MTGRAVEDSPRRYAVLGRPVRHSLSPAMQNAAFRAAGIDARYDALEVAPEALEAALARLHAEGMAGLNLTLPLKEAAWPLVLSRTAEAERARAVNTLRREERGWAGHATDGPGFAAWSEELGLDLTGSRVLLLGAGGAAASVAFVLLEAGVRAIGIASRTVERARSLASRVASVRAEAALATGGLDVAGAAEIAAMGPFDLLVRALASEEVSEGEASLWGLLAPGTPVLDLNYGARADRARVRCRDEGRPFEDGLGLLLQQGALSFEFWTGRKAPLDAMRQALAAAARDG